MRLRIDPPAEATHYATLYGVPCYFIDDGEGCSLCGTNVVADWLLEHYCPLVQDLIARLAFVRQLLGVDECREQGFPICLRGPIQR